METIFFVDVVVVQMNMRNIDVDLLAVVKVAIEMVSVLTIHINIPRLTEVNIHCLHRNKCRWRMFELAFTILYKRKVMCMCAFLPLSLSLFLSLST